MELKIIMLGKKYCWMHKLQHCQYMQYPIFHSPKKLLKKLIKYKRLFGGGKTNDQKINWVKWKILRKNKGDGGMGFRDL